MHSTSKLCDIVKIQKAQYLWFPQNVCFPRECSSNEHSLGWPPKVTFPCNMYIIHIPSIHPPISIFAYGTVRVLIYGSGNNVPNCCQSVCPKQKTLWGDREFKKKFFNLYFGRTENISDRILNTFGIYIPTETVLPTRPRIILIKFTLSKYLLCEYMHHQLC